MTEAAPPIYVIIPILSEGGLVLLIRPGEPGLMPTGAGARSEAQGQQLDCGNSKDEDCKRHRIVLEQSAHDLLPFAHRLTTALQHSTLLRPFTPLQPLQKIRLIKGNCRPQVRIHRAQAFAEQFKNFSGQGRLRTQLTHPGQCSM